MMVMFQEDTAILNSDISHTAGVEKEQGCISHRAGVPLTQSRGGRRSRGASHTAGVGEGAGTHRGRLPCDSYRLRPMCSCPSPQNKNHQE